MNNDHIEELLKNESSSSFDLIKEKAAFMKCLEAADIKIPMLIESGSLHMKNASSAKSKYAASAAVLAAAVIMISVSPAIAGGNNQIIRLKSPVLASLVISNDADITDDPEFDLTLETNGQVSEVVAVNDDAKTALGTVIYTNKTDLNDVTYDILDCTKSTDYLNINATIDAPNKINVLLTGSDGDIATVKKYLSDSVKSYLKQNYVYAYMQSSDEASEMNKADIEEARKLHLDYEKYILIKKIYLAVASFDDYAVFNQAFVDSYKNLSLEELTIIVNSLSCVGEKMEIIKKLGDIDRRLRLKVEEYRLLKKCNFREWKQKYDRFNEHYQYFSTVPGANLFTVDSENIIYEDFDLTVLMSWLDSHIDIDFSFDDLRPAPLPNSKKTGYFSDDEKEVALASVAAEYEALKTFVVNCRTQETLKKEEMQSLIADNKELLLQVGKEQHNKWKELQSEREEKRPDDRRHDSFYRDFDQNFESFFGWF